MSPAVRGILAGLSVAAWMVGFTTAIICIPAPWGFTIAVGGSLSILVGLATWNFWRE